MSTSAPVRVALDTNLVLRMWARRYLAAAIAGNGNHLVLPATATDLAIQRYDTVTTRINQEVAIERWARVNDPRLRDDRTRFTMFLTGIAVARTRAFAEWLQREPGQAPRPWTTARRTERSEVTAIFLRTSGALGDPEDGRYGGTGEDAQVLAEAIEARCVWIGTSNYHTLDDTMLDTWLSAHDPGLTLNVPFIVPPDAAVSLLYPNADDRQLAQIAYAAVRHPTNRPDRHQHEARDLKRLQRGLAAGDMTQTALRIGAYAATRGGFGPALAADLEQGAAELLDRTRAQRDSDARRREAEHRAVHGSPLEYTATRAAATDVVDPQPAPDTTRQSRPGPGTRGHGGQGPDAGPALS